jgi:hypothetical protein
MKETTVRGIYDANLIFKAAQFGDKVIYLKPSLDHALGALKCSCGFVQKVRKFAKFEKMIKESGKNGGLRFIKQHTKNPRSYCSFFPKGKQKKLMDTSLFKKKSAMVSVSSEEVVGSKLSKFKNFSFFF